MTITPKHKLWITVTASAVGPMTREFLNRHETMLKELLGE